MFMFHDLIILLTWCLIGMFLFLSDLPFEVVDRLKSYVTPRMLHELMPFLEKRGKYDQMGTSLQVFRLGAIQIGLLGHKNRLEA